MIRKSIKKDKMILVSYLLVVIAFLALGVSTGSYAANPVAQVPTLFDPGRVGERVGGPLMPRPSVAAPIQGREPPPAAVPSQAEKIRFQLNKVILEGNKVYKSQELESFYRNYLHKKISLIDLQKITEEITKKYRSAGYILSRAIIPAQEIKDGVVRIQVIEGYISRVDIKGDPGKTVTLLRKYSKYILRSRPLQIDLLEHYSLLANDVPGLTVKSVITPSQKIPASADLTFVVEREKGGIFGSYNNYGTRYIGPNQFAVTANLYSLLMGGDNNTFRIVTTSKETQLQYAEYSYGFPLGSKGMTGLLGGNYTETNPGFTLAPFNIIGRSISLYLDLVYPFIRSRTQNLYMHALANYQNVSSTIASAPFYNDLFRTLTVGASYELLDRWRGVNGLSIDVMHSFPFFGAVNHVNQSRPDGKAIFTKTNVTISRLQGLGSRFSLLAAATGQNANVPLLATQQFGFGGPSYGRGYDPSEIVGDMGFAAKLEFRVDAFPTWAYLNSIQYYIFYDIGEIWNRDKVNLPAQQSASSTGFGLRFNFLPNLSGEFFLGKPLTRPVATMVLLDRNGMAARAFFQVVAKY